MGKSRLVSSRHQQLATYLKLGSKHIPTSEKEKEEMKKAPYA